MSSSNKYPFYQSSTPLPASSSSPSLHQTALNPETYNLVPSSPYRTFNSSTPLRSSSPSFPIWPSDKWVCGHKAYENKLLEVYATFEIDPIYSVHRLCAKEHAQNVHLSMGAQRVDGRGLSENSIKTTGRDPTVEEERNVVYERQPCTRTDLNHVASTMTCAFSIDRASRIYPLVKLSVKRYTALRQIQIEELGIFIEGEQSDQGEEEIPLGWIGEDIGEGIINLLHTYSLAHRSDHAKIH